MEMLKGCILMGSPRNHGNTAKLVAPFMEELAAWGMCCEMIRLHDLKLEPCIACRICQDVHDDFGCFQDDDMAEIFEKVLAADLLVLATPIYSWYATPPMKAVMDRLVYGMNKYYGKEKGPSLWAGKPLALITTCGYPVEKGADLWEEGIRRYCKHSRLEYLGMLAQRDMGYDAVFMDADKDGEARGFGKKIFLQVSGEKD
ncbi:MAG: flavodoxin family protein [Anaerovoracaceae bacterium]|jgi:NAD(P)H-dependent FMN reductase